MAPLILSHSNGLNIKKSRLDLGPTNQKNKPNCYKVGHCGARPALILARSAGGLFY